MATIYGATPGSTTDDVHATPDVAGLQGYQTKTGTYPNSMKLFPTVTSLATWNGLSSNASAMLAANAGHSIMFIIPLGGSAPSAATLVTFLNSLAAGQEICFCWESEAEAALTGAAFISGITTLSNNLDSALATMRSGSRPNPASFYTRLNFPVTTSARMDHYASAADTAFIPAFGITDYYGTDFYHHNPTESMSVSTDARFQHWLSSVKTKLGSNYANARFAFPEYGVNANQFTETQRATVLQNDKAYMATQGQGLALWNYWYQVGNDPTKNDWRFALPGAMATQWKTYFTGSPPPPPPPSITSFTPSTQTIGGSVTVTGANFTGATSAKVNTTTVATFTVNSDTSLTLTVPAASTTGKISITTPNGTGTSVSSLTVGSTPSGPTITSFTPSAQQVGGSVSVTGAGFTGTTDVKVGTVSVGSSTTGVMFGSYVDTGGGGESQAEITARETQLGRKYAIDGHFYGPNVPPDGLPEWDLANGRTPLVTTSFGWGLGTFLGYASVTGGSQNSIIDAWATYLKGIQTSGVVFLRLFQEFNGTWMNYGASTSGYSTGFANMWRYIYNRWNAAGVDLGGNIQLIWSPNAEANYSISSTTTDNGYPGDAYVDIIGVDIYNKDSGGTGAGLSFANGLGAGNGGVYDRYESTGKPFIAPEFGCVDHVLNQRRDWFNAMKSLINSGSVPLLKALVYWDSPGTSADTAITLLGGGHPSFEYRTDHSAIVASSNGQPAVVENSTSNTNSFNAWKAIATDAGFQATSASNNSAGTFTVVSDTNLTFTVPTGATTAKISVTTPQGTGTSVNTLTVGTISAPTITSFTPASANVGSTVTVTGTNLSGATAVKVNTTSVTSFTVNSATSLTLTVPTGATTGKIAITTPGGTATSTGSLTITTAAQPPTITGFTPTTATSQDVIVVNGTNFTGTTEVRIGGSTGVICPFVINNSTQLQVVVPATATTGPVYVKTPAGATTSSLDLTITTAQPPTITSFTPTSVNTGGTVTVTGTYLTGATSVTIGATNVPTYTIASASTLTLTVPSGASSGTITITTGAGSVTSGNTLTVTNQSAPTITSFTPSSGAVGDTVTITGTNLSNTSSVRVGGAAGVAAATVTNVNSTTVTFNIPPGATSGKIYLATPGGSVSSTATLTVTVTPPGGGAVIKDLPQGLLSRTATMQVRAIWTTDAQAQQVASECVLISGPFSMPRLATMMTTNPNLIVTPYLKSIQNPKGTNTFDPNGTIYPAAWYAHLKDGTKAIQTGAFNNWVMESGVWSESHTSATVAGDLSGQSITAASFAEYHIKDAVANVAKVNAQATQQATSPFRGLWFDSMSTFSADNVTGFWGTTNPGWSPHTNLAYTKPNFRLMAYYIGDQARTATLNPNNLWVVGNGLREVGIGDHVDMAMAEGWLVTGTTLPSYGQAAFETKLDLVLGCQAKGCVAQILEWGQSADTPAVSQQRRRNAAAAVLLTHRGLVTYEYGAQKTLGPWLETAADPNLYSMNLGTPLNGESPTAASGLRTAVGSSTGQASATGLYNRLYSDGAVLYNISTAAVNYKADRDYDVVPNPGGAAASYSSGSLIPVPANSAVFVTTRTSTFTAPANTDAPYILNSPVEGSTLIRDRGNWTGTPDPSYTDQWQVSANGSTGWTDIAGATGDSFAIPFGTSGTSQTQIAADAYGRTVASGWGSADSGGTWAIKQGVAGDYAVSSNIATISHGAASTGKLITLDLALADVDAKIDVNFPNAAAGGPLQASLMVRFSDTNNFLDLNAFYSPTTGIGVTPRKVIAGVATSLGTAKAFNSYVSTDNLHLRLLVTGSRIQGKAWQGAASEPAGWDWDVTDSTLTAAGGIGARSFRGTANTNTSPQTKWDNLAAYVDTPTVAGYVGEYFRVQTTATNTAGAATASSSAAGPVTSGTIGEPQWTVLPSITGQVTELAMLTARPGTITGTPTPTTAYQWQSSADGASGTWTNVSGATSATYTLPSGSSGDYYRVRVRASNTGGTLDSYAQRVGPVTGTTTLPSFTQSPTVTGTPVSGNTLTATPGTATGTPTPSITSQWQRSTDSGASWHDITGATSLSYPLTNTDVGSLIRLTSVATNINGADQAFSTPIGPVQYPVVFPDFQLSVTVE